MSQIVRHPKLTPTAPLVSGATFALNPGHILALVGPNGSGKSTLLAVLAGSTSPGAGTVRIEGSPVDTLSAGELSRCRSVLTQEHKVGFAFSVDQVIRMGRHPYAATETTDEHESAFQTAVRTMELEHLLNRPIDQLSGGEQARCAIARVLTQATPLMFLDEPTAALDLRYQHRLIAHCEQLADSGGTVLMVVHDLSFAARADLVGLIHNQALIVDTPETLLTSKQLESTFDVAVDVRTSETSPDRFTVDGVDLRLPRRKRSICSG